MSKTTSLDDAQTHSSQSVDLAAEGKEIVTAKNGTAPARLAPLAKGGPRKPAGALGLISIRSDFDDPLPNELQALFEGR